MKRYLSLLSLALLLASSLQAQSLFVAQTSGNEAELSLSNISRLSFSQGNMLVSLRSGSTESFAISSIRRLYFGGTKSAVRTLPTANFFQWQPVSRQLTVSCTPGSRISVYTMAGSCVATFVQSVASSAITLDMLPAATYIVEAEGRTAKIICQ